MPAAGTHAKSAVPHAVARWLALVFGLALVLTVAGCPPKARQSRSASAAAGGKGEIKSAAWTPDATAVPREPVAPQPLPSGLDSPTGKDYHKIALEYYRQAQDALYQKVGAAGTRRDARATSFVAAFLQYWMGEPGTPPFAELLGTAQQLRQAGTDDPIVLYAIGVILYVGEKHQDAEPVFRRLLKDVGDRALPKRMIWAAPGYVGRMVGERIGEKAARDEGWEMARLAAKWFVEAASEAPFADGQQRVLWQDFRAQRDIFGQMRKELRDALVVQPNADPWIKEIVAGECEVGSAWSKRGSGWAFEVTEEGWAGFGEHLDQAREHLIKAWQLQPGFPEAAWQMISVVMGGGPAAPGESVRLWFDRAVAAQFDYMPAYNSLLWAMMPRWGGSHEEMLQFGRECLATKRFDTEVPGVLYDAAFQIAELDARPEFWLEPGVYEDLSTLFKGLIGEPARANQVAANKSSWAAAAVRCERYGDAKRLLAELGDALDPDCFGELFADPVQRVTAQVFAKTGAHAADVEAAESAYLAGQVSEALRLFEKLQRTNVDGRASRYLRDRVAALRMEDAFSKGDWVSFMPGKDFAGWTRLSTEWRVLQDGSAEIKLQPGMPELRLMCEARLGDRLEVRGQIQFATPGARVRAGVKLQYKAGPRPSCNYVDFDRGAGRVWVGMLESNQPYKLRETEVPETVSFYVQLWDSNVNVFLNGKGVFAPTTLRQSLIEAGQVSQVAVSAYDYGDTEATVRFRNLQIRQLASQPPTAPTALPKE